MPAEPRSWWGFARTYLSNAYLLYALQLLGATLWVYFVGADSYGFAALYTAVVVFPINLLEVGLTAVVYSPATISSTRLDSLARQQSTLGLGLGVGLALLAWPIAHFVEQSELLVLLLLTAGFIPLVGLGKLRQRYIYRLGDAQTLSLAWWVKLVTRYVVAVLVLAAWKSPASLAIGAAASLVLEALMLLTWKTQIWRPSINRLGFGAVAEMKKRLISSGENIVTTILEEGDAIFFSNILGELEYGYYAFVRRLFLSGSYLVSGPLNAVILPLYRESKRARSIYDSHLLSLTTIIGGSLIISSLGITVAAHYLQVKVFSNMILYVVPLACWAAVSLPIYATITLGYGIDRITALSRGSLLAAVIITTGYISVPMLGFVQGAQFVCLTIVAAYLLQVFQMRQTLSGPLLSLIWPYISLSVLAIVACGIHYATLDSHILFAILGSFSLLVGILILVNGHKLLETWHALNAARSGSAL